MFDLITGLSDLEDLSYSRTKQRRMLNKTPAVPFWGVGYHRLIGSNLYYW